MGRVSPACPTGNLHIAALRDLPVVPFWACTVGQITGSISPVPLPLRGAFRDRHERWKRDAVDARMPNDERHFSRTAKSRGPGAATLAPSRR
jgi:hypothetical protein